MSCLFDSVSSYTKNCSSPQLRQMVADYLSTDPCFWGDMRFSTVFQWFDPKDVHYCKHTDEYIRLMRNDSTWGGALEIQSMCNMFNIGIRVYIAGGTGGTGGTGARVPIEFVPAANMNPSLPIEYVLDITWDGCHFEAFSEIANRRALSR